MSDISPVERIAELERERHAAQQRFERLQREIEEMDADLQALRRVTDRKLLSEDREPSKDVKHGELRKAVIAVLPAMLTIFTVQNVLEELSTRWHSSELDPASVSSCLRRLAADGVLIREQQKGSGRRKTIYHRLVAAGEVAA